MSGQRRPDQLCGKLATQRPRAHSLSLGRTGISQDQRPFRASHRCLLRISLACQDPIVGRDDTSPLRCGASRAGIRARFTLEGLAQERGHHHRDREKRALPDRQQQPQPLQMVAARLS
jgi:hypothetical protein